MYEWRVSPFSSICRYRYTMRWCRDARRILTSRLRAQLTACLSNLSGSQTMPLWRLSQPPSQSILVPAWGGLEGAAGSQAKGHWQGLNARSYHVYSDPETGIPTLCAAKHVCLLAQVIISVAGLRRNKSWHIIRHEYPKQMHDEHNALWTSDDQSFSAVTNCKKKNMMTQSVSLIWLY